MGVSQWRNHGKDYGYWSFWEDEIRQSERESIALWFEDLADKWSGKDVAKIIRSLEQGNK